MTTPDYDNDFFAWTQAQAAALRQKDVAALDLEHLAEEIESMGKRDRRAVESSLEVRLRHGLKWVYQPQRRSGSWRRARRGSPCTPFPRPAHGRGTRSLRPTSPHPSDTQGQGPGDSGHEAPSTLPLPRLWRRAPGLDPRVRGAQRRQAAAPPQPAAPRPSGRLLEVWQRFAGK